MLQKTAVSKKFPRLFQPSYIGRMRLKNRLVRAPAVTCTATIDGYVSDRTISIYREEARGGVGLIIVEMAYTDDIASRASQTQLSLSRDDYLLGMRWLAETIQENGAKACLQISHCGRCNLMGKPPIKGVSRIPWSLLDAMGAPLPEELTIEEIRKIVEDFGDTALRAKKAGFDMVQIHGAHDFLLCNFLQPSVNKRTDCYGGSLENRMRVLLEVVENTRKKVGPDYPLCVRLSAIDYMEVDPITIEETKEVAKALEKAGIDCIHISAGGHVKGMCVSPMYVPPAPFAWMAEEVKKVVDVPVIASESMNSPGLAEKILEEGKADYISIARSLYADPYFPLKAQEDRPEDIAPCIRCLDGCLNRGKLVAVRCSVNPALGKEEEFRLTPVAKPKKVAIIGGGPAGMEAARVAALRGHEVTLYEKRKLGGMLIEASIPEFKADIRPLIDYLSTQVKKTGVKVIESEATSQTIKDGKFDAVIVAAGASPWVPDVRGIDKPFVLGILDVLRGAKTGKNVIVVGGGMIACDVALFLAEQGKKVTITTRQDEIARDMEEHAGRIVFLPRLFKQDVEVCPNTHLEEIVDGGVIVHDRFGTRSEIKGDNVVLAAGFTPNRKLFDELEQVPDLEVFAVGDCVEPGLIFDAIHQGFFAAYSLGR